LGFAVFETIKHLDLFGITVEVLALQRCERSGRKVIVVEVEVVQTLVLTLAMPSPTLPCLSFLAASFLPVPILKRLYRE
jgi:hypothetical protein